MSENKRDDGGPAFPVPSPVFDDVQHGESVGMTLRDYFAGQIMAGVATKLSMEWFTMSDAELLAQRVYMYADAMLRARSPDG